MSGILDRTSICAEARSYTINEIISLLVKLPDQHIEAIYRIIRNEQLTREGKELIANAG